MTDKLDIFEMPPETRIVTTIRDILNVYVTGESEGIERYIADKWGDDERVRKINDMPVIIHGDIV